MSHSHAQVRALIEELLELDAPEARLQRLAACQDAALAAEAGALLGLETQAGQLDQGALQMAGMTAPAALPAQFGPYRITGVLGRGGMGDVYLGVRHDGSFDKEVAIKVVRDLQSPPQVQRFQRERMLLARLEHPAIARVLDGGSEHGQAWMAIERVVGVPLDAYVRAQALGVRERVALMLRVLDGVQYAHQNLIVHRDLKPSNILVQPDGQPKLLDFGVAKLIGTTDPDQTRGLAPMTYAYAAPEQIQGGAITTATDVYALGVILYEVLTGERPHKPKGEQPLTLLPQIIDTDVAAPSAELRRRGASTGVDPRELQGDLDTIVLKALSREPQRRYPSAQALRDDLARYLQYRPIQARPDTWGYRAAKWLRRNRAIATVSALALAGLLIAASLVLQQRDRAVRNAQVAEATKRFVLQVFAGANRWQTSQDVSARELALRGLETVASELKDQPEARIEMYDTLGQVFGSSGPASAAVRAREAQLREMQLLGRYTPADLLAVEMRLLLAYLNAGDLGKVREYQRYIEGQHAGQLSAFERMFIQHIGLQASFMLGDFGAVAAAFADLTDPAALRAAAASASRAQQRELATFASWAYTYGLQAAVAQRRDRETLTLARATVTAALRDVAPDDLQRANLVAGVLDALMRISSDPALLALVERSARWSDAQYGGPPSAAVGARLFVAEQAGDLALAERYYAQLQEALQSSGGAAEPIGCREILLAGASVALALQQRVEARQRYRQALSCAQAIGGDAQSAYSRAADAGLAYLDLLEGQADSARLQRVAAAQAAHDDGLWWRSAAWLAEHCLDTSGAQCQEPLEQIRHWHEARGARYDHRLLGLYARAGLPVPTQPEYAVSDLLAPAGQLLADGERILKQRLQ